MSKYRQAARIDANQPKIVEDLEAVGCSVEVAKDDILVGYKGRTLWVEIKTMDTFKKSGGLKAGTFKPSQIKLIGEFTGDYMVAWTSEQIMHELGIK